MDQALHDAALDYHAFPSRGKISATPTKALATQRDLSLAYSPGVAAPCMAIYKDPLLAAGYTYPNQVNNVLCFPFIFRGALDAGASTINEEMKLATVRAIAALAQEPGNDDVARACGGDLHPFGPNYLIPSPYDPRLILRIAPAVAQAAMDSGVATLPIADMHAYRARLAAMLAGSSSLHGAS